ncbi:AAA family ATPase [Paenibacillus alkaliterrae]|uniref:AAA family ATPase n=1 Tax=Paenibacillus alkaliterrae TaxID=320909 RepID=UPI001F432815|nr:AAA family ATPase [Paenibacillus alkaliterrae]MCF2939852.1 AAA family ATPase [Paenibacillus alkaliterrae]
MRLHRAEIDGFGQLFGKELSLDAPVILVYGPNEAGKSTMFSFIRTMLYGFAKRGQAADRQEPVNGGKHGGRLFFGDQTGERYVLDRYAADGTGRLKVRSLVSGEDREVMRGAEALHAFSEGVILTQTDWERTFLGGVSERLYRQLFAITLTELQEIGALSGDELGRYLYHAGWDGGKSIAAAEKRLSQEMDALFKPRGTIQQINQQLKTLEQVEAALRRRKDAIAAYNDLIGQSELLDHSLNQLESELPLTEARLQLLNKACAVRPLWLRKQKLLIERNSLTYALTISAQAARSWEELRRLRAECRDESERTRQKLMLLELQLEAIRYDEHAIRIGHETDALLQTAESIRMLKEECSELDAELREHDEAIARLASSIAPEWTERQLRGFSVTVAERDYVRNAKQQESELSRTTERFSAELEALGQQEREAVNALDEADAALEGDRVRRERESAAGFAVLPLAREALREAWNAVDRALREWELERVRTAGAAGAASGSEAAGRGAAAADRGRAGPLWTAAAGAGGASLALGAAALSGAAAGEAAGGAGLAALALAGAALALVAAALVRSRGGGGSARAASRAEEARRGRLRGGVRTGAATDSDLSHAERRVQLALETIVREPAEAAAALLAAKHHSSAEHLLAAEQARSQLRAAVEGRIEALQISERLQVQRSELARRLSRLRAFAAERSEAAAAAAQIKQAAAGQWAGWLAARSLPAEMSPSAALEAFELAGQALQRLHQYDRLAAKQAAARDHVAAFAAQAAALCEGFEEAERQLAADPVLALRLLHAESRRHAAAEREARGIEERRAELLLSLNSVEARMQELQAAIAAQLEAAGIDNEQGYESALGHRQQAALLELELSKLEVEITAGMPESRIAELEELYAASDEEQLQALQAAAQAAYEQLEKQKREQLEQRGRLRQSVEHLFQEEEQQQLLAQKAMTIAQLEADMERYAVLSISAALIRKTKRIYEEERQPVVLRKTSLYVSKLTDGKYIRVLATPGETGIRLESSDRRLVDSSMLSRGTAEQVYLAMRFALAEEAAHSVKLPFMLDDVFVNFDRGRLHAVARLAAELSNDRQLIVMTCHEHIRDAMLEHCGSAALISI